jgi:hypothetical protein
MMTNTYGLDDSADRPSSPKELAAAAAQTVKNEVSTFAASTQEKLIEQVEQKKETAGETLSQFASAIRTAGDELAKNDQSMAGHMVKKAADGLESFTRSISDKRPEELVEAVRDFGRRNPGAFVAGALLAGLAVGRFLRSSASPDAPNRPETSPQTYRPLPSEGAWPQVPKSPLSGSADSRLDLRADVTGEMDPDIERPLSSPGV